MGILEPCTRGQGTEVNIGPLPSNVLISTGLKHVGGLSINCKQQENLATQATRNKQFGPRYNQCYKPSFHVGGARNILRRCNRCTVIHN